MSEPAAMIINHGGIEQVVLPAGFVATFLPPGAKQNNYLEFHVPGSATKICYEETNVSPDKETVSALKSLFADSLMPDATVRRLNVTGEPDAGPDETAVYDALSRCIVAGGCLVRGGSWIDEDRSVWEIRRVGASSNARTIITGRLRFNEPDGRPSPREAILALTCGSCEGGCFYLWLEGEGQEVRRYEPSFFDAVIGCGKFKRSSTGLDGKTSALP